MSDTEHSEPKSRGKWNMLFSAGDPELEKLAHKIQRMIPPGSILNSTIARRIIGVLKSLLESKAEGLPPVLGALLEKATDLGDMVAGVGGHAHKEHSAEAIADDWMNAMFADAGKRLKEAPDPTAELEKIKTEFAARLAILEMIEKATAKRAADKKAAEPPKHTPEPIDAGLHVDNFLDSWKNKAKSRGYTPRRKT